MLEIKVFSIPYEKHFSAIFIRFSRSCSDFDEFLFLISFIPTWMTALPKFPFSNVASSQWYNSFKLNQWNILNCANRFPSIWLNCLCHIPFGVLSPKMICVYFFSLLSPRCYSCHIRCLRRYNFLICETCLFFWMIVNNYLTTASWFRYHWLISQEIFIFWESEKLVFCCRFINAIKRLEFMLWLKFTDSFEFLSSCLKEFFGDIKLCSLWIWKSVGEGFNCCSRHFRFLGHCLVLVYLTSLLLLLWTFQ